MNVRTMGVSLVSWIVAGTACAAAFDLTALPADGVGDNAWTMSGACSADHRRRTERFVNATKAVIKRAAPPAFVSRGVVAPNIVATYQRWRSSYAVSFDVSHPTDLQWLAACLRIAGAEPGEAEQRGLHHRPLSSRFVDFEFSPQVGFYYIVDNVR